MPSILLFSLMPAIRTFRLPPLVRALLLPLIIGCGGNSVSYQDYLASQDEVAAQIKLQGGDAQRKRYPLGEGWVVKLKSATITDETFEQLKILARVAELDLSHSTISDEQIPRLVEVGGVLHKLNLSHTAITDASLPALAELVLLGEVNLQGTKITKAALAEFKAKRRGDPKVLDRFKNTKVIF